MQFVCLSNDNTKAWTKDVIEGENQKKEKAPYICCELCCCLLELNLRKTFHGNHNSKFKTDSKFVNIFKYLDAHIPFKGHGYKKVEWYL